MLFSDKKKWAKRVALGTGIWVAADALGKLFAMPHAAILNVFHQYDMLDWMIPMSWIEFFVALLYLWPKSRFAGYLFLMTGMSLVTAIHLVNGGSIIETMTIMSTATAALIMGEPEVPEEVRNFLNGPEDILQVIKQ